jgi:hypothetical protein
LPEITGNWKPCQVAWVDSRPSTRSPDLDYFGMLSVAYGCRKRLALHGDGSLSAQRGWMGGMASTFPRGEFAKIAGSPAGEHHFFLALGTGGTITVLKHLNVEHTVRVRLEGANGSRTQFCSCRWPCVSRIKCRSMDCRNSVGGTC